MMNFKLDKLRLADWLADELAGEQFDQAWDPTGPGGEGDIDVLVSNALQEGIIQAPPGLSVAYCHCDGVYVWFVDLRSPSCQGGVRLATAWLEQRRIVMFEAVGADAIRQILEEAVAAGNELLEDLAGYAVGDQADRERLERILGDAYDDQVAQDLLIWKAEL